MYGRGVDVRGTGYSLRPCVLSERNESESAGDFGNRGRRLPRIGLYLRVLIGKGCVRVDEWGARCAIGVTLVFYPMTGACQPSYNPWSAALRCSVTATVPLFIALRFGVENRNICRAGMHINWSIELYILDP